MKITDVRPWVVNVGGAGSDGAAARRVVRPPVFVEGSTDESILGLGSALLSYCQMTGTVV